MTTTDPTIGHTSGKGHNWPIVERGSPSYLPPVPWRCSPIDDRRVALVNETGARARKVLVRSDRRALTYIEWLDPGGVLVARHDPGDPPATVTWLDPSSGRTVHCDLDRVPAPAAAPDAPSAARS